MLTLKAPPYISHPGEILPLRREFHGAGRPAVAKAMAGRAPRAAENLIRQDGQDFGEFKSLGKRVVPKLPLQWNIVLADICSGNDF